MVRILHSGGDVLREAYKSRGVFLVLGAGVSFNSGLPNWPDLLKRLFLKLYEPASGDRSNSALYEKLKTMPAPMLASFLQAQTSIRHGGMTQREAFAELVRDALYHDFHWRPPIAITTRHTAETFVRLIDSEN